MKINLIDSSKELFCKICVYRKLVLFDKDEEIYKCPSCGSLFKYNMEIKKPKLTIDSELSTTNKNMIFFKKENKQRSSEILPEVAGNIQIKETRDL